jgi:hypothetical protein
VPAVGAFDDPAARLTANAADERRLAASANMRLDATTSNLSFGVGVVVALVKTEVTGTPRPPSCWKRHSVKSGTGKPFVVDVGAGQSDRDRDAALVGQDVTLGAELAAIGRVRPREVPPLGAFTEALSREAHSQPIPRSSS